MMDKIIVKGGQTKLQGEVEIEGAKNAVLPLLAATLLASEGEVVLTNVPILSDVFMMNNLVNHLGTAISFDQEAKKIIAKSNSEIKTTAPETGKKETQYGATDAQTGFQCKDNSSKDEACGTSVVDIF